MTIGTRVSITALIAGLGLLAVSAMGEPAASATGWTLRVEGPGSRTVDPAAMWDRFDERLVDATCLRLVRYATGADGRMGTLVPEAAVAIPWVSRDGRTYVFRIRTGFTRFSNGERVTAYSFLRAIQRVRHSKMWSSRKHLAADIVDVRVRRALLVIRLERRVGDLLARMATSRFCAVPTATIDARMTTDALVAPLAVLNEPVLVSARIGCLRRHPLYGFDLTAFCLRR